MPLLTFSHVSLTRRIVEEIDDDNPYHVFRKTSFYGLSNEEWLTLVVKYCCVLMVRREEEVAMDILEHVVWSGLFHNRRCEIALRLTIIGESGFLSPRQQWKHQLIDFSLRNEAEGVRQDS